MRVPIALRRLSVLSRLLIFVLFFAMSGCTGGGGNLSIYQDVRIRPVIHRFALSARQRLRDLSNDISPHLVGADSGITVRPGEKVEIFANGVARSGSGQGLLGPGGAIGCHTLQMPEPALTCYAVIYSVGVHGRAGEVGPHISLLPAVIGNLFLGINAPDVRTNSGSFQLTVVVVPDGTFTGLWASPQQGFAVQGTSLSLSAYVFTQAAILAGVSFTLTLPGRAAVSICQAVQSGVDLYTCSWDLLVNGEMFPNGQVTVGLSLVGSTIHGSTATPVVNPDGVLTGTVTSVQTQVTDNYAGYAATDFAHPAAYQQVSGRWTVPPAVCLPGEESDASLWVGMTSDASSQSLLAQLGTATDCQGGQPLYYMWWELYPAPSVQLDFPLQAGDQVSATVMFGDGMFRLGLAVPDEGVHFSVVRAGKVSDTSVAECIVEPATIIDNPGTSQGHLQHLTNFGQVTVHCQLNGKQPIAAGPQDILYQMQTNTGVAKAFTSVLDASGTTFTVRWHHA